LSADFYNLVSRRFEPERRNDSRSDEEETEKGDGSTDGYEDLSSARKGKRNEVEANVSNFYVYDRDTAERHAL
jgi:hypothetical protein